MTGADRVYRLLYDRFGHQGWWPTTPQGELTPLYHTRPGRPLTETDMFEICVGAILTQNTAWTNVKKALVELNRHRLLDPRQILNVPFSSLAKMIRSSGYFRQKAKKLRFFSRYLIRNYSGKVGNLLKRPMPALREELLGLYGLGPETADSILLYAGGFPVFVVDAYTRRIGNRVGLFSAESYGEVQKYFEVRLRDFKGKKASLLYNEYHALLVALGKNYCRTRPLCKECPLRRVCRTGIRFKD